VALVASFYVGKCVLVSILSNQEKVFPRTGTVVSVMLGMAFLYGGGKSSSTSALVSAPMSRPTGAFKLAGVMVSRRTSTLTPISWTSVPAQVHV